MPSVCLPPLHNTRNNERDLLNPFSFFNVTNVEAAKAGGQDKVI